MDLDKNIKPTSVEELNRRIDKSEDDLKMRGIKV
jgi:hypothetical protein